MNTQETLESILGVVTTISQNMNGGRVPSASASMSTANGMGSDVTAALKNNNNTDTTGLGNVTSALKDLSSVNPKNILKLSIIDWEGFGENVSGFFNGLKGIDKSSIEAAKAFASALKAITTVFADKSMVEFAIKLKMFPLKLFESTITGIFNVFKTIAADPINVIATKKMIECIVLMKDAMEASSSMTLWAIPAMLGIGVGALFLLATSKLMTLISVVSIGAIITFIALQQLLKVYDALAGMMWKFALLGILAPLFIIPIFVGFAIISLTMVGMTLLMSEILTVATESITAALGIRAVRRLMTKMATLPLYMALVGVITWYAWKFVLVGFLVIAATATATLLLAKQIAIVSKEAGEGGLRGVGKILLFLTVASLLPFLSIAIAAAILAAGKSINAKMPNGLLSKLGLGGDMIAGIGCVVIGYALIAASVFGIVGLIKVINKHIKGPSTAAAQKKLVTVLAFLGTAVLFTISAIAIGWMVSNAGKEFIIGLGICTLAVGATALLIKATSKIKKDDAIKGAIVLGVAAGVLVALGFAMQKFAETSALLAQNDLTWWSILAGLGVATLAVAALGALMIGIAFLVGNPLTASAIAIGGAVLGAISLIMIALGAAMNSFADATKKVNDMGGDTALSSGFTVMTSFAFGAKKMLQEIGGISMKSILKAMLLIHPLHEFVDMISKFVNIISKVSGDGADGTFRIIAGYDKDGNPIYGESVNIEKVGTSIGTGFGLFASSLMKEIKGIEIKVWAGVLADQLETLMNPVNAFVSMIADQEWDDEGNMRKYEYDENGNRIGEGKTVKIAEIGGNIAKAFTLFAKALIDGENGEGGIKNISYSGFFSNTDDKIDAVSALMEPVSSFVDTIIKINEKLADTDIEQQALSISSALKSFLTTGFNYSETSQKLFLANAETFDGVVTLFDGALTKLEKHNMEVLKETKDAQLDYIEKISESIDKNISKFEQYSKALDKMYKNQEKLTNQLKKIAGNKSVLEWHYHDESGPKTEYKLGTDGANAIATAVSEGFKGAGLADSISEGLANGLQEQMAAIADGGFLSGTIESGKIKVSLSWDGTVTGTKNGVLTNSAFS